MHVAKYISIIYDTKRYERIFFKEVGIVFFFSYNINVFSDERTPNITTISYDELYSTDHKELPLNDMYLSISSILEGSNLLNKTHNFTGHPDLSKVFY